MRSFHEMLAARAPRALCVGIDPDLEKIPERVAPIVFLKAIIAAVAVDTAVFKLNLGFFLGHTELLYRCISFIREVAPEVPIILDGKFGDIGASSAQYARFAYDDCDVDAVTVNPYLGLDAVRPFVRPGKGVYLLAHTSNESASETQDVHVIGTEPQLYYQHIVKRALGWSIENLSFVMGATYLDQLRRVREIAPSAPLLIPGIGKQGGDLVATVKAAMVKVITNKVDRGFVVNISSGIMFPEGTDEFKANWSRNYGRVARDIAGNYAKAIDLAR